MLVGSLKASNLYRMEFKDNQLINREIIIECLARIRDIEQSPEGDIYLLLEHKAGGQIVRIIPD